MLSESELEVNKGLTHWFIQMDPTTVSLVPRLRQKGSSGGHKWVNGSPRSPQEVKMIPQAGVLGGIQTAEDGLSRRFDFVLLAEWDAIVVIGDHWVDDDGNTWVVESLDPYNGYEVKAGVKAYGKALGDG